MNEKTNELFERGPVSKAVLSNVIPSVVSMIMVLFYNLADTFFIGQTKNAYMVAAVSLGTPVFMLFLAVGLLFGVGGTSLASRNIGEGKKERAKNISSFCFWTGIIVGVVGMTVILVFLEPISYAVGASADTIDYVQDYLGIIALGIPFLVVSNAFSHILRAEGKAHKAMTGMIIGNLVNIVLDPVFILGAGWNVKGAAIATVIGNVCGAAFYLVHVMGKGSILSVNIKNFKVGEKIASGVLAIGIPAALNSILMSVSNIIINNLMTPYGDMAVAGLGVAMKVNMIAVMLLIGVGSGVQPLLGYCFGAGNKDRFNRVLRFTLIFGIAMSAVMTTVCYLGAGPMVNVFLEDKDAYSYGMEFARVLIYSGPVLSLLFIFTNAIQSMGAAVSSLILSISRQGLLYIPIVLVFNASFDSGRMLAMAQPVTDYFATALAVILFAVTYKKYFAKKQMQLAQANLH